MLKSKLIIHFILFTLLISTCKCRNNSCPNIIGRSSWQAREPTGVNYLINPLAYAVIHHTVTEECDSEYTCSSTVRSIQDYHMDHNQWTDIGFSFLIGGDGNVYEGVGWSSEGAHTYKWNKKAIGIAFIGNFQNKKPSELMLNAGKKLIACGKDSSMLRPTVKIIGAIQVTATLSPGKKLYQEIKTWPEWLSNP